MTGLPRANITVDRENPNGVPSENDKLRDYSVLQQHIAFFDRWANLCVTSVLLLLHTSAPYGQYGFPTFYQGFIRTLGS